MICKECKPVYGPYQRSEERLSVKHIELCERHANMERNQVVLEAMIASGDADDRQRRRYALLKAAALVDAAIVYSKSASPWSAGNSVDRAEELLAEIEKREHPEA